MFLLTQPGNNNSGIVFSRGRNNNNGRVKRQSHANLILFSDCFDREIKYGGATGDAGVKSQQQRGIGYCAERQRGDNSDKQQQQQQQW